MLQVGRNIIITKRNKNSIWRTTLQVINGHNPSCKPLYEADRDHPIPATTSFNTGTAKANTAA